MKLFFILLLMVPINAISQKAGFDKSIYYDVMTTNDLELVNKQLELIKNVSFVEKDAYEGAMLMKKAGLVTRAKEKLSLFKAGRIKLETSIKKDSKNIEFSFLRLIIQEHAPKAVNYKDDLESDSTLIRNNYKTLPPVIQQAIADYSKKSKILKSIQP